MTTTPSKLHTCSDACGFCRATARLAAIEARKAATVAKFEAILDAEAAVCSARCTIEFQLAGVPLFVKARQHKHWVDARAVLSALIDGLSVEEAKAFGPYRMAARA